MDTRAAIDNAEKQAIIIVERDGGRFTHLATDYKPGMVLADDSFKPEGYVEPENAAEVKAATKTGKGKASQAAAAPAPTPTPATPTVPAATLKLSPALSWSNGAWTSIDEISAKAYRVDQQGNVLIKEPFETAELAAAAVLS